jgi:hypothetical protein
VGNGIGGAKRGMVEDRKLRTRIERLIFHLKKSQEEPPSRYPGREIQPISKAG